jgi:hypothetical protein
LTTRRYQLQTQQPNALLRIPEPAGADTLAGGAFSDVGFSLKLEDLADEWFVSRATLQNDMAEVREHLQRYHLTLETRPRHGMKLFGSEMAIRACLTDLLWTLAQQDPQHPLVMQEALNAGIPEQLQPVLQDIFARFHIRLTDEGELFLRCTARWRYGGLAKGIHCRILPQKRPINRCAWPREIAAVLHRLADKPLSVSEELAGCILPLARYRDRAQRHQCG